MIGSMIHQRLNGREDVCNAGLAAIINTQEDRKIFSGGASLA
jgi:hypothetical protein